MAAGLNCNEFTTVGDGGNGKLTLSLEWVASVGA